MTTTDDGRALMGQENAIDTDYAHSNDQRNFRLVSHNSRRFSHAAAGFTLAAVSTTSSDRVDIAIEPQQELQALTSAEQDDAQDRHQPVLPMAPRASISSNSAATEPTESARLTCRICDRTFKRVEHLNRHARAHQKERAWKCAVCHKGFYRVDALRRHEQTHKSSRRSDLPKGFRACINCAKARRKCSGQDPCESCHRRQLGCRYITTATSFQTTALPATRTASWHETAADALPRIDSTNEHTQSHGEGDMEESIPATAAFPLSDHLHDHEPSNPDSNMIVPPVVPMEPIAPAALAQDDFWYPLASPGINWLTDPYVPDGQALSGGVMMMDEPTTTLRLEEAEQTFANRFLDVATCFPPEASERTAPSSVSTDLSHRPTSPREDGRYYVDGDGARLPHMRKRRRRGSLKSVDGRTPSTNYDTRPNDDPIRFPDNETSCPLGDQIDDITFEEIRQSFVSLAALSPAIEQGNFPSVQCISHFVSLYKSKFRSSLPFSHSATFQAHRSHWLGIVAMAAIGCHYHDSDEAYQYVRTFTEFLQRAIHKLTTSGESAQLEPVLMAQIQLLGFVAVVYSGEDRLSHLLPLYRQRLAAFCEQHWLSARTWVNHDTADMMQAWMSWVRVETIRRTGYSIWLLDGMFAHQFDTRPLLSLEAAQVPLPCQDAIWDAGSAEEWTEGCTSVERSSAAQDRGDSIPEQTPSLNTALQILYIEKHLPRSTGEFSRILLIYGLFRRTWDVASYHREALSQWTPTAAKQTVGQVLKLPDPIWLPGNSAYSKWRNSACDCLDTLHWQANATIGAALGMEHPTVLHLHLARCVLLTPFSNILHFAKVRAEGSIQNSEQQSFMAAAADLRLIKRWAQEDQYKARLAIVHAGVLLWHVRRYSVDAFYEPSALYLAVLVLWAYGSFTTPVTLPPPATDASDSETDPLPTSMPLDRPADDELVQLFVKRGRTMQATVLGVGNLCSDKGPRRVLIEGRKIMLKLDCWGITRQYLVLLSQLINTTNAAPHTTDLLPSPNFHSHTSRLRTVGPTGS